jgi:site-specific DNA-methyltransferase (adenine-specific)
VNHLYYGDNLDVLRENISDESVDLIYLDPPFNSGKNYNVLFKSPSGEDSQAQIQAFEDTWHWSAESERFLEQLKFKNGDLAELLDLMVRQFGRNDLSAYLVMMAVRLVELHRVLKSTGSLYLHCDQNASHYLKLILDNVFGRDNFRNEIIWHYYNKYSAGKKSFAKNYDQIFFYSKTSSYTFHPLREKREEPVKQLVRENVNGILKNKKDANGNCIYRIVDDKKVDSVWRIPCLQPASKEMLNYPTQKPVVILERLIQASSNPGDVILDPFCGCGTAVHAAQKLGRKWVGIDITHLAIAIIENRLKDAFTDIEYEVHGTPKDLQGANDLANRDKYQFQWWACSLVNAQPYQGKKKGADGGIDGQIFFTDLEKGKPTIKKIIVSVKGGNNVSLTMLKDLIATVQGNKAEIGLFITLASPTKPMLKEAASCGFYKAGNGKEYPRIQILTIEELLKGKRPEFFDMSMGELTFKKSQRDAKVIGKQQELF